MIAEFLVLFLEVIYQYRLLVLVAVPPFVGILREKRIFPLVSDTFGFASASRAIDPFVLELVVLFVGAGVKLVKLLSSFDFLIMHERKSAISHKGFCSVGDHGFVESLSIAFDPLRGWGDFPPDGRTIYACVRLLAVLVSLECVSSLFDMGLWEGLGH